MRARWKIVLISLVLTVLLVPGVLLAQSPGDEIARNLMCQCGCNKVVADCDCGTAQQMIGIIRERLDKGETREQVMAYFVSQYGEKVLAAPTKQGFNLTAWIIPFAAVVAGGGGIYLALRTWVLRGRSKAEELQASSGEEASEYEEQLKRELEEFDKGS